jgi:hypothetical protein
MYQVQVVWNREFDYRNVKSPQETIEQALFIAKTYKNLSDGEAVKKAQIIDEQGNIIVPSHKISY